MRILEKNKIKRLMTVMMVVMMAAINVSASGSSSVSLSSSENFADSGVVRREDGESVTFKGSVKSTSNKKGTFVARYQRNGSWYNDYSTAQKAISPGKSTQTTQASTGHKYYVLRIVSGNDTIGVGNTGTIATGTIQAK